MATREQIMQELNSRGITKDMLTQELASRQQPKEPQYNIDIMASPQQMGEAFGNTAMGKDVVNTLASIPRGFRQAAAGLGQLGMQSAEAMGVNTTEEQKALQEAIAQRNTEGELARKDTPIGTAVGEFVGESLPSAPAFALGPVSGGAVIGAMSGVSRPDATGDVALGDRVTEGIGGTVIGATTALAAPLVVKGIGKGIDAVRTKLFSGLSDVDSVLVSAGKGVDDIHLFDELKARVGEKAARNLQETSNLYKQATKKGADTVMTGKSFNGLQVRIRELLPKFTGDDNIAVINDALSRVRGSKMTVNDLETLRKAMVSSNAPASSAVKATIDDTMEKALSAGDIVGNKDSVRLWKAAIKSRRDYGMKFENPKYVAAYISDKATSLGRKNITPESVVSEITPEALSAKLFGAGSITTARNGAQAYDQVVNTLGKDAEPILKQAIVGKMLRYAGRDIPSDSIDDAVHKVWFQRVSNEIKNLRTQNKSLWNKFSSSEKEVLRKIEVNAYKTTQGGIINKLGNTLMSVASGGARGLGLGNDIRLPSTLSPKKIGTIGDIIRMSQEKIPVSPNGLVKIGDAIQSKVDDDVLAKGLKKAGQMMKGK